MCLHPEACASCSSCCCCCCCCCRCSVLVHKDGRLPPEFAALWTHPTLLAIAQQLLVSSMQLTGNGCIQTGPGLQPASCSTPKYTPLTESVKECSVCLDMFTTAAALVKAAALQCARHAHVPAWHAMKTAGRIVLATLVVLMLLLLPRSPPPLPPRPPGQGADVGGHPSWNVRQDALSGGRQRDLAPGQRLLQPRRAADTAGGGREAGMCSC
jgi:hypothetical protein